MDIEIDCVTKLSNLKKPNHQKALMHFLKTNNLLGNFVLYSMRRNVYTNGIGNFHIRHGYFPNYHACIAKYLEFRSIPENYICFNRIIIFL